jgi:hypothetical protein
MRPGREHSSGQELVEYAIIFPVLMLLLLGIIEFGRIIYSYNAITNAAREGTRLAILPTKKAQLANAVGLTPPVRCDSAAAANEIIARVCERAMALSRPDLYVTVSQPDPQIVQIQVEYRGPFLTNLILQAVQSGGLRLQTAATMRLE